MEERDIVRLDAQAAATNTSRAEVIRQYINAAGPSKTLNANEYNALVQRAYAFAGGGMDRRQFEGVAAYLFTQLRG